jgi:hypothetical protein
MGLSTPRASTSYVLGRGPVLYWYVAADPGSAVTVTGPDGATLATTTSGTLPLCPGTVDPGTNTCTTAPGDYGYRVTIHPGDGSPDRYDGRTIHIGR